MAAPLAGSILGSTGGGAAAGVFSGLAGDFAGQSLAIGMGVQNGYNYTQLAFSGFAGGAFGAYAGFRDPTLGGLLEAPAAAEGGRRWNGPGVPCRRPPSTRIIIEDGDQVAIQGDRTLFLDSATGPRGSISFTTSVARDAGGNDQVL